MPCMHARGRVRRATRRSLAIALLAVPLATFAAGTVAAAPRFSAAVAFAHDSLVYVSATDSGTLAPGMRLGIERRGKRLANVTVIRLVEPRLAAAHVDSGLVTIERGYDELGVIELAQPPVSVAMLKVGIPGRGRGGLLFNCASAGVESRLGPGTYSVTSLGRDSYRMVRADLVSIAPDTVLARLFSDAADEEIALERGDIDVAVFWPGELSARMRADARWRDRQLGLRRRGFLACVLAPGDSMGSSLPLLRMNDQLFAGDLLAAPAILQDPPGTASRTYWAVDPALPGFRIMERTLNGAGNARAALTARLWYRDNLTAGLGGPGHLVTDFVGEAGGFDAFAIRCAVVASPAAGNIVHAIGPDAFANLMVCGR